MAPPSPPRVDVIVVGGGSRAHAWTELLARASRARLVALVARDREASLRGLEVPRFDALDAALAAFPEARVAAALPPRAGLETALTLAARDREGLVAAPLALSLARAELPAGAARVQVAHGWTTLRGARSVEGALSTRVAEHVAIEARGLPEERGGDVGEVLSHALALALRLCSDVRVERVESATEARIDVVLRGARARVSLRALASGQSIDVGARGRSLELHWHAEDGRETLASARDPVRERACDPPEVRALHQLVAPSDAMGDDLVRAQRVARLVVDVHDALGRAPRLGARALRHSAHIARSRPDDQLARLGLRGALPQLPAAPALIVPAPPEPLELWLFRAAAKPVAFLTVPPDDADRIAALFEGAHVERRARRVRVEAQDAWIDRRDAGEERVELYVSRDPALAREAARLQAERDPSASIRELGALMGYPACCVEAFADALDRSNNTLNRYATFARTPRVAPWPWELANLHTMLIPCYPCSYLCERALALARTALDAMERAYPGSRAAIRACLARPVLYFDHDHQIVLHGELHGDTVRYAGASVPAGTQGLGALGGAIAAGDELTLDHGELVVRVSGEVVVRLARTDPGLGILAPFGVC